MERKMTNKKDFEVVRNFKEISKEDVTIAGGKGASLGEMTQAGIPVPEGFVVLSNAFEKFLEETDLNVEIDALLDKVDVKNIHIVNDVSENIRGIILNEEIPSEISKEIKERFKKLDSEFVAVRSSATSEDSASAAWAGQLETYLNTTEENLLDNVKKCWASLFTPRAIFYRFEKKLHKEKISVAVVIQKMIESEESGVSFSVHPVTQDENQIVIEAGFGLGEAVVSGQITPDTYVVDKKGWGIIDKNINEQLKGIYKKRNGGNEWKELGEKGKEQVLKDKEIIELAKLILKIEKHYGFPVDVEWAKEKNKFYITQSRPITTIKKTSEDGDKKLREIHAAVNFIPSIMLMNFEALYDDWILNAADIDSFGTTLYIAEDYKLRMCFELDRFALANKNLHLKILNKTLPLEEGINNSIKIGEEIKNIFHENYYKISEFDDNVIKKLFTRMFKLGSKLCVYGYATAITEFPTPLLSQKLEEILESRSSKKDIVFLTQSKLERPLITAKKELLRAIMGRKNLNKWLKKWFWIEFGQLGPGYSLEQIKRDYKEFFKDPKKAKEELDRLINEDKTLMEKQERKFKKLKLNEEERNLFYYAQNVSFLKAYRIDILNCVSAFFDKIFEEYSKKFNCSKEIFHFSTKDEIMGIINKELKVDRDLINKRKKHSLWIFNSKEMMILSGKEAEDYESKNIIFKKIPSKNVLTGNIAFPGKVKGVVKIISENKDMEKLEEGDVLVAIQTAPEFIPAMKKASAFITDIGGITCHAAIVSREMKKPCVVGTQIATRVLKDGDLVEVDADKGIVRKIKNEK